ncbi:hypothetical protein Tco_0010081 [Tanacetum coccineum]
MERVHYLMQVNQQTYLAEFPQIDSGLAVLVFKQGDDPIDAINKMMSFLSTVVTSRFLTTNNQLRNSSNPRQQATIHDGRTLELQKVIQVTYKVITNNESLISNDLMRMIQTGDDFSIAQGILMSSFILVTDQCSHSRLPQSKNTNNDMLNQTELERHKEQLTTMASEQLGSGPGLKFMTPATSSSGLITNLIPQQPFPVANAPRVVDLADSPMSTSIDQDAPSTSIPSTQEQEHAPIISQGFKESPKTLHFHDDLLHKSLHEDSTSQGSFI